MKYGNAGTWNTRYFTLYFYANLARFYANKIIECDYFNQHKEDARCPYNHRLLIYKYKNPLRVSIRVTACQLH